MYSRYELALKEQRERHEKFIKEQKEKLKKEQRKELIIVIGASALILVLLFKTLINMNNSAINNCIKQGYSQQVCEVETA